MASSRTWLSVWLAMALASPALNASPIISSATYFDVTTSIGEVVAPFDISKSRDATLKLIDCTHPCNSTDCWQAQADTPYLFSYAAKIDLPKVGSTIDGGYVDQTFYNTTKVHENWHYNYIIALANATYGTLQDWSASYVSNCYDSPQRALAHGEADLENALAQALNAYNNDINTDVTMFERPTDHVNGSYAEIRDIGGVDTWRSVRPDWGQPAVNYANHVAVAFSILPGDPGCLPEPSSSALVAAGCLAAVLGGRRRAHLGVRGLSVRRQASAS